MADVIACDGLVKSFGSTRALDGLDLRVQEGEIHGFLGPNGAGKTVTMRILLGLIRQNAGRATVFGADPWADAVALHRRLAYVPGDTNLWPSLTGGEIIDLLGDLRGGIDPVRRAELIERFDLDPRMKARAYSKGNRQKVALVAALASDAQLLILDEPTAGLDPLMEAIFQDALLDVVAEGRTVLLSSHILAEVEKVCDRVTIIRKGRAVETGTLSDLRVLSRVTMVAELATDGDRLAALPGVHDLRRSDGRVSFEVDHDALTDVVRHLGELGVRSLESTPPTLEELFLRHYGDELQHGQVDHPAIRTGAGVEER
ncbi:MAG: ABC transporter ATP-binding protein [Ilumatobacteraceae bacterium]|nr:ABC transporter ATP-binding protein [Ilumatobacteraceae bacterium]